LRLLKVEVIAIASHSAYRATRRWPITFAVPADEVNIVLGGIYSVPVSGLLREPKPGEIDFWLTNVSALPARLVCQQQPGTCFQTFPLTSKRPSRLSRFPERIPRIVISGCQENHASYHVVRGERFSSRKILGLGWPRAHPAHHHQHHRQQA
jgi:hypothetical protein